ncbi:T9SS sorting signal type C domain-containing protein [Flavobacterium luminosum]|uniref:T9SS sorting signal type C domain-containing protein n=1 Tax=Flavobacterium luminosum TaxID=2949086 RepID=A0ABT0TKT5_9FLAO|nr:T9SS sorting signal type C domain-containing protein [Flavobacterium sp. HXWNR70]MCL9807916.1 T9SS sorting signal type C domain-containing protein [Flavobacterium sp. HXWNR70]
MGQKNYLLKKRILPLLLLFQLFLFNSNVFAQSVGDYRSVVSGNWTTLGTWQYYNGSAWVTPSGTNPQGYPGQYTTGNVTIASGHTVTIGGAGITTQPIASITINGNLLLNGNTSSTTTYNINSSSITVTPLIGTIQFENKVELVLPANAVLQVKTDTTPNPDYNGLIGDCSHNQDIKIGTLVYAYCKGGGSTALTFDEIMQAGGTLNAVAASNGPICAGNSINLSGSYVGGVVGTKPTYTYTWSIKDPNNVTSTSNSQNPVIPNAITGTYQATLTCTMTYSGTSYSNSEIITILVNAKPAKPSVDAVIQPNCSVSTGSVSLSNLPTGNWTINPGNISGTGNNATITGLATGTYNFAVTNAAGCTSDIATVVINSPNKTWNGTVNNDWFNANNWSPSGVPTAIQCVTIPNTTNKPIIVTATTTHANCNSLTILSGGTLEVTSGSNLHVTDFINVNSGGVLNLRNSANLIQTNNVANSGSITMDRTANNLHLFDYVYWSSPVENFTVTNVSPLTPTSKIYHWVTTHYNGSGYGYGNWLNVNENMVAGKGYIVRVPNGNTSFSTTFAGKPHNGVINKGVLRGPTVVANDIPGTNGPITTYDDNWNLVGNPYPSAIDAIEFLTANSSIIQGEVNLWTHSSAISTANPSPYYQTFSYNYKSNDYVTYNGSGDNIGATKGFNGKIAAGQGFFVKMIDGAAGSGNITFNNSMRTDGSNNAYNNGQFYRTSSQQTATTEPEKHRIWLDLIDSNMNTSRFMAGYIEGATHGKDHLYDATTNYSESLKAFTMLDQSDDIFVIQGRSLPFDPNDKINFGIQVPANATYKIAIADVDGLFKTEGQKIYVEDLLTNTTHDLTVSPYSFTSDKGIFKNRFVIKFNDQKLSNTDNEFSNSVVVFGKEQLTVKSELFSIKDVTVYDVLGKTLLHAKNISEKEYQANALRPTNSVILVKATLENGTIVTKKVIF